MRQQQSALAILTQSFIDKYVAAQSDDALQRAVQASLQSFRQSKSHKTFQSKVKSYGLELHDVARDGNCFFSAVLDQLQQRCPDYLATICQRIGVRVDQITQATLRRLAVGGLMILAEADDAFLRLHTDHIQTYLQHAAQESVWADNMMTSVLCRVLRITVVLLNSDANDPTVIHGGDQGTLYLGYEVQRHFQSTKGASNEMVQQYVSDHTTTPLPAHSAIDVSRAYHKGGECLAAMLDSVQQQQSAVSSMGGGGAPAAPTKSLVELGKIDSLNRLLEALNQTIEACRLSDTDSVYINEFVRVFNDKKTQIRKMLEPKQLQNRHLVEKNIIILEHLQSLIDSKQTEIAEKGLTADNQALCASIFSDIQNAATDVLTHLGTNPVKTTLVPLSYIERQVQKRIVDQQGALKKHAEFRAFLEFVKQKAISGHHKVPSCFICYAWPADAHPEEHWVQPFLKQFRKDLMAAGIEVKLDIKSIGYGGDGGEFMGKGIENSDFVILIGSESMLLKSQKGLEYVVPTELNLVVEKYKKSKAEPVPYNSPIIPLLLSGTIETAFPAKFRGINMVKRPFMPKGYLKTLKDLIIHLYVMKGQSEIKSQWKALKNTIDADPQLSPLFKPSKEFILLGYSKTLLAGRSISLSDYLNACNEDPYMNFEGCDFEGINLTSGDISGFNFKNSRLRLANLTGVTMLGTALEGADLSHCSGLKAERLAQAIFIKLQIDATDSHNRHIMYDVQNMAHTNGSGGGSASKEKELAASAMRRTPGYSFIPMGERILPESFFPKEHDTLAFPDMNSLGGGSPRDRETLRNVPEKTIQRPKSQLIYKASWKKVPSLIKGLVGLKDSVSSSDAEPMAQHTLSQPKSSSLSGGGEKSAPLHTAEPIQRRKDILKALDQTLSPKIDGLLLDPPENNVLRGYGGVGKTTLAAYYARAHREDYELTIWFKANEPLKPQFKVKALAMFGLSEEREGRHIDIVKSFYATLSQFDRWLIIFDDVKLPDDIARFLPRAQADEDHGDDLLSMSAATKKGCLITSRYNDWGAKSQIHVFNVGGFSLSEVQQFLTDNMSTAYTLEEARQLAKALDAHPYALTQAVNTIERSASIPDITTYLQKLEAQPKAVFSDKYSQAALSDDPASYSHGNVLKAFAISIDDYLAWAQTLASLDNQEEKSLIDQLSRVVIACLGYLQPGELSSDLVLSIIEQAIQLKDIITSSVGSVLPKSLAEDLLQGLSNYSLLRHEKDTKGHNKKEFTLHQLMRRSFHLKQYEQDPNTTHPILLKAFNGHIRYDRFCPKANPDMAPYFNQAIFYLDSDFKIKASDAEQAYLKLCVNLGDYYLFELRYCEDAQKWFEKAQSCLEHIDDVPVLKDLQSRISNGLGFVYYMQKNDNTQAIHYFKKTLSLWDDSEKKLSNLYSVFALRTIGYIKESEGYVALAKQYYDTCLSFLESYQDSDYSDARMTSLSIVKNTLAGYFIQLNDFSQASIYYSEAIEHMHQTHPEYHIELYLARERQVIFFIRQAKYGEAIKLLEEMCVIQEVHQDQSNRYYTVLYRLYACYQKQGKDAKAVSLLRKIFSIATDGNHATVRQQASYSEIWLLANRYGHMDLIRWLLSEGKASIKDQDKDGDTALLMAAMQGHLDTVQYLLHEGGASITEVNKKGFTALLWASLNGHQKVVAWLLQQDGINIENRTLEGYTALLLAASQGHLEVVQTLLESGGASIAEVNEEGFTALLLAALMGHQKVVVWLLQQGGVSIAEAAVQGYTALLLAARQGHLEVVQTLLEEGGASVSQKAAKGYTALLLAAQEGQIEVVKCLLESGRASIEDQDENGYTALLLAARQGHLEVVQYLLHEGGAKIDESNKEGMTALHVACAMGHGDMVQWLLKEGGASVSQKAAKGCTALLLAARLGQIEVVKCLLESGRASIEDQDEDGYTALLLAASQGHLEVVQTLLEEGGASITEVTEEGFTALLCASLNGHQKVVAWLLQQDGINIENRTLEGYTALLLAASQGHLEVVQTLLEEGGASITEVNEEGLTALLLAAAIGHRDLVVWLLQQAGVSIADRALKGNTALLLAASQGHLEVVQTLLEEGGASITEVNEEGLTALLLAAYHGHKELVVCLLGHGASITDKDKDGDTALLLAARQGHLEVVQTLLESGGASIAEVNEEGFTAFLLAAAEGHRDLVVWLLQQDGINIEDKTHKGNTALLLAIHQGHDHIVTMLVQNHPELLHIANHQGELPLDVVLKSGHVDCYKILLEKGGLKLDDMHQTHETVLTFSLLYGDHGEMAQYLVEQLGKEILLKANDLGLSAVELAYLLRQEDVLAWINAHHPDIAITLSDHAKQILAQIFHQEGTPIEPWLSYLENPTLSATTLAAFLFAWFEFNRVLPSKTWQQTLVAIIPRLLAHRHQLLQVWALEATNFLPSEAILAHQADYIKAWQTKVKPIQTAVFALMQRHQTLAQAWIPKIIAEIEDDDPLMSLSICYLWHQINSAPPQAISDTPELTVHPLNTQVRTKQSQWEALWLATIESEAFKDMLQKDSSIRQCYLNGCLNLSLLTDQPIWDKTWDKEATISLYFDRRYGYILELKVLPALAALTLSAQFFSQTIPEDAENKYSCYQQLLAQKLQGVDSMAHIVFVKEDKLYIQHRIQMQQALPFALKSSLPIFQEIIKQYHAIIADCFLKDEASFDLLQLLMGKSPSAAQKPKEYDWIPRHFPIPTIDIEHYLETSKQALADLSDYYNQSALVWDESLCCCITIDQTVLHMRYAQHQRQMILSSQLLIDLPEDQSLQLTLYEKLLSYEVVQALSADFPLRFNIEAGQIWLHHCFNLQTDLIDRDSIVKRVQAFIENMSAYHTQVPLWLSAVEPQRLADGHSSTTIEDSLSASCIDDSGGGGGGPGSIEMTPLPAAAPTASVGQDARSNHTSSLFHHRSADIESGRDEGSTEVLVQQAPAIHDSGDGHEGGATADTNQGKRCACPCAIL